jgi:hypothetical protein
LKTSWVANASCMAGLPLNPRFARAYQHPSRRARPIPTAPPARLRRGLAMVAGRMDYQYVAADRA